MRLGWKVSTGIACSVLIGLTLPACGNGGSTPASSSGQTINWDFDVYTAPTNPLYDYYKEFADLVKQKTNGQFVITVRAPGELPYQPTQMVRVVGDGSVQMGDAYAGFVAGDLKHGDLPYLPMLIGTPQDAEDVMSVMSPSINQELNSKGSELLFWYLYPQQKFWGTGQPIRSLQDLKGRKVRTTSPELAQLMKAFGAESITLATADVPTSAQRGMVNTVITAGITILGQGWYDFTKWGYTLNVDVGGPSYVIVNKQALDSLPQNDRDALKAAAAQVQQEMLQKVPSQEEDAYKTLKEKYGIEINTPSQQDTDAAVKAAIPIWTHWAETSGGDLPQLLQQVRTKLGK